MAERASDLVQAVKAALCGAMEGEYEYGEDGSMTIPTEPAARAAIRATLEALRTSKKVRHRLRMTLSYYGETNHGEEAENLLHDLHAAFASEHGIALDG